MSARDSRSARDSTASERAERDAQRQERDVQRAEKRQKRHEQQQEQQQKQQQSPEGLRLNLVQDRDGQPVHATATGPQGPELPTWGLFEKLLMDHPSLAGSTEYKRFLTRSGNAYFKDAFETLGGADGKTEELVEHIKKWQQYMTDRFERFAHPGAGGSSDAPVLLH